MFVVGCAGCDGVLILLECDAHHMITQIHATCLFIPFLHMIYFSGQSFGVFGFPAHRPKHSCTKQRHSFCWRTCLVLFVEKTCSISSIAKQAIRSDLEIYMLRTGRGSVVVQRKRDLIVGLSKNNDDFNFWAFPDFQK